MDKETKKYIEKKIIEINKSRVRVLKHQYEVEHKLEMQRLKNEANTNITIH